MSVSAKAGSLTGKTSPVRSLGGVRAEVYSSIKTLDVTKENDPIQPKANSRSIARSWGAPTAANSSSDP
jgi:hypothetical protein